MEKEKNSQQDLGARMAVPIICISITSVRDGIKRGLRQLEKYFEKNLL